MTIKKNYDNLNVLIETRKSKVPKVYIVFYTLYKEERAVRVHMRLLVFLKGNKGKEQGSQ